MDVEAEKVSQHPLVPVCEWEDENREDIFECQLGVVGEYESSIGIRC